MKAEEILAEFQFLGNRVSSLNFDARVIEAKAQRAELSFEFDYNVKAVEEHENKLIGIIEFIVKAKATSKKKIFFEIDLVMEGAFAYDAKTDTEGKFQDMLEINGIVTLSQISRAYILSVTSQSGIPPVKMPMINVIKLRERKKKED
ncbi:MAG: protein-export chaperone SecB [Bacillota bacterium]|nr:protein-export chaperone SecB [Bacillota bacterium]